MSTLPKILPIAGLFFSVLSAAFAGDPTPTPAPVEPTESSTPATNQSQILLGITTHLNGDKKSSFYDKVIYKGQQVTERGKAPSPTDATGQFIKPSAANKQADTPSVLLNFVTEPGTTASGNANGSIFDALKAQPFALPGLNIPHVLSVAELGGQLDGNKTDLNLGFERASLSVPDLGLFRNASFSAYLNPGVMYQQEWGKTPIATTKATGAFTYRFFYGYAGGWMPSTADSMPYTLEDMRKAAPNHQALLDKAKTIAGKDENKLTDMDKMIAYLANKAQPTNTGGQGVPIGALTPEDFDDPVKYLQILTDHYDRFKLAATQEPSWALWWENRASYAFTGRSANTAGYKDIDALTLSFWKDAGKARNEYQLRWENGTPFGGSGYLNQTIITVGVNF